MLRTGAQYREGLRDGRVVYYNGDRVEDVTTHPSLGLVVDEAAEAMDFRGDAALRAQLVKTIDGD